MAVQSIELKNRNKLVRQYVNGELEDLFAYDPFNDTNKRIAHLQERNFPREELAKYLKAMNETWQAPEATFYEIERLRDERSVVVIGGQQAGLLSGPLYTVHKIISIIKYAREQEELLGIPVIPVFWIAGEDHDYDEINHIFTHTEGKLKKRMIGQVEWEKKSISHIPLDEEMTKEWVKQVFNDLVETEYTRHLASFIFEAVEQSNTFVDFFARIIFGLFKEEGIVLVDAADEGIRDLEAESFAQLIEKQEEITESIFTRAEKLSQAGYPVQVDVSESDANLFYHDDRGERILLMREEGRWVGKYNEVSFTTDEMLSIAKNEPNRLSNNVMTRPLMQETLFPTLAFVAGDGEISYWALLEDAFPTFDSQMKMPPILPRLSITLLTKRVNKLIQHRRLDLSYVVNEGCRDLRMNWLASKQSPPVNILFNEAEANIANIHKPLQALSTSISPDLGAEAERNLKNITKELDYLRNRMNLQLQEQYDKELEQFEEIQLSLRPNDGLQERTLNILFFLNECGLGFIREIIASDIPFTKDHHLISIEKLSI